MSDLFRVTSPKAQYTYKLMADNENSTSSYVALNPVCICRLFYRHRSGDHGVTGVHGDTRQGESLPTIYPKV